MKENLENLSLAQLYDLLVSRTQRLLNAIEQRAEGSLLHDLKTEVESVQSMISVKKEKARNH